MSLYPDTEALEALEASEDDESRPDGRQSPRCSFCGERGHRRPTCPNKPREDVAPPSHHAKAKKDAPPERGPDLAQLDDIETQLTMLYTMFAQIWGVKDPQCASVLQANARTMAKSWTDWARTDPKVAKILTSMSKGSGMFGVAVAHMPLAFAVFQHHGPQAQMARRQENLEAAVKVEAQNRGVPEEVIWEEVRAAQEGNAA